VNAAEFSDEEDIAGVVVEVLDAVPLAPAVVRAHLQADRQQGETVGRDSLEVPRLEESGHGPPRECAVPRQETNCFDGPLLGRKRVDGGGHVKVGSCPPPLGPASLAARGSADPVGVDGNGDGEPRWGDGFDATAESHALHGRSAAVRSLSRWSCLVISAHVLPLWLLSGA